MTAETEISADEVALYDRQIRLWGMKSQARMRNSKILIINMAAVANEIAKDLVLAGIGSLTIVDSHITTEDDFGAQFFVQEESGDVGKNRGEAALPRIKLLNRHVTVESCSTPIMELDKEFIKGFDVVLVTQATIAEILHVTHLCDQTDTANFVVGLSGLYSYAFVDLREYEYTTQSNTKPMASALPEYAIMQRWVQEEPELYRIEAKHMFKSFHNVLDVMQTEAPFVKIRPKYKARINGFLPVIFAAWGYEIANPGKSWGDLTPADLHSLATRQCEKTQLPSSIVSEELAKTVLTSKDAQIATTSSIIGGGIAQEVLNYLSRQYTPMDNFYIFDGWTGDSPIYHL